MNSGVETKKEISIRFCGLGGMGVILVSVILGKAAIYDDKNAIQTQSYGAEQRGTKVRSDVIISESDIITYPVIDEADVLIALSQDAFDFYYPTIKDNGLTLINSDLIKLKQKHKNIHEIPATSLARELNNEKVANLVMLGALIKLTNILSINSVKKAISNMVKEQYIELNFKAFQKGHEYIT
jgi:2-oxoglutarate ferredoxin oxidoreductase subunit gamma